MAQANLCRHVGLTVTALCCLVGIQAAPAPREPSGSTPKSAVHPKNSPKPKEPKPFTPKERLEAIRRAQVWTRTDIPSMDLKAGPQGGKAFDPGETVICDHVKHEESGSTPKFRCVLPSGDELKVRYGEHNGEVYGQVAATRLFWALGLGANRMYPVAKVVCRGCPWKPFEDPHREAGQPQAVAFDPVTIDVKMSGKTLETKQDEGWIWKELDRLDESAGGAPLAHRDALKLLAVLVQHTDSKASNQRLLCLDKELKKREKKAKKRDEKNAGDKTIGEDETAGDDEPASNEAGVCAHPFMMVTDLGKTFGHANTFNRNEPGAVNFTEWSHARVWKDPDKPGCTGDLPGSATGSLENPRISEAGRKFLADLLIQLSDTQLHDLFDIARFVRRDPSATVDDWVRVFKQKRDENVKRTCSS
jgi:hypothetical protein